MGNIVLGQGAGTSLGVAIALFAFYVIIIIIFHIWATALSLRKPRFIQNRLDLLIVPLKWLLFHKAVSKQEYSRSNISEFFRVNGYPPDTTEYKKLSANNFSDWRLKIYGLVASWIHFLFRISIFCHK